MSHSATTRIQEHIGDPFTGEAPVDREQLEEIFQDIQADMRYDHELNGCLNCGICTATCPAAHYYDFSPREIVQLLWTENLEGVYDAMQEKIWACAQCYTCAARCPFGNSPGGLIMLMRETAIKHGMESAKNVLRPFSRSTTGERTGIANVPVTTDTRRGGRTAVGNRASHRRNSSRNFRLPPTPLPNCAYPS